MEKDFSKCQCTSPGYCKLYNKKMEANPPNWQWCQDASHDERLSHYIDSAIAKIKKECGVTIDRIIEIRNELKKLYNENEKLEYIQTIEEDRFKNVEGNGLSGLLYKLTSTEKNNHICHKSREYQYKKNQVIINRFFKYNNKVSTFDNVEILCVGHSNAQFDTIQDRRFLKKLNLNDISAGRYSGNEWAEARVFASKNKLFSDSAEFVGCLTASWNIKYEPYSPLEDFENWKFSTLLLNSKPDDNIVLCADIHCVCAWTRKNGPGGQNILTPFFGKNNGYIGRILLKLLKFKPKHIRSPYSNQMIMHKSLFYKYIKYLEDNDIFGKIDWFVKNYAEKYLHFENNVYKDYHKIRVPAYLMEFVSCMWFNMNDFFYIPVTDRKDAWYAPQNVLERNKNWQ